MKKCVIRLPICKKKGPDKVKKYFLAEIIQLLHMHVKQVGSASYIC